ncbi:MAG: hypothetical protein HC923_02025, partial [Myxococcales bacterium]|nr:hypothetical protein [Myxococcales bacterium]
MASPARRPLLLEPRFQTYAWGDQVFLPRLFRLEGWSGPCAEAWMGAHPMLPSNVFDPRGPMPLDGWLRQDSGGTVEDLPFLFKVLSVARPLSVQVHPDEAGAREGFSREDRRGIARNAHERSYRDQQAKPEILVALTDVEALCGFRSAKHITKDLEALPELRAALPPIDETEGSLRRLVRRWFETEPATRDAALRETVRRIEDDRRNEDRSDDTTINMQLGVRLAVDLNIDPLRRENPRQRTRCDENFDDGFAGDLG